MITVTPSSFTKVKFEVDPIETVATEMVSRVGGLPDDFSVELIIKEDEPTTRMTITSLDPVVFTMDSGALEDTRDPRTFGEEMAQNSIGRLLYEFSDRTSEDFAAPALGEPADFALRIAWDTYCYGRVSRLGVRVYRPKHLYNFRNRLGFTDEADRMFERLWMAESLTWADIVALCAMSDQLPAT